MREDALKWVSSGWTSDRWPMMLHLCTSFKLWVFIDMEGDQTNPFLDLCCIVLCRWIQDGLYTFDHLLNPYPRTAVVNISTITICMAGQLCFTQAIVFLLTMLTHHGNLMYSILHPITHTNGRSRWSPWSQHCWFIAFFCHDLISNLRPPVSPCFFSLQNAKFRNSIRSILQHHA